MTAYLTAEQLRGLAEEMDKLPPTVDSAELSIYNSTLVTWRTDDPDEGPGPELVVRVFDETEREAVD